MYVRKEFEQKLLVSYDIAILHRKHSITYAVLIDIKLRLSGSKPLDEPSDNSYYLPTTRMQ